MDDPNGPLGEAFFYKFLGKYLLNLPPHVITVI